MIKWKVIHISRMNTHKSRTTQSYKNIPAGQGNTVAVSGQYDPMQKASVFFGGSVVRKPLKHKEIKGLFERVAKIILSY